MRIFRSDRKFSFYETKMSKSPGYIRSWQVQLYHVGTYPRTTTSLHNCAHDQWANALMSQKPRYVMGCPTRSNDSQATSQSCR